MRSFAGNMTAGHLERMLAPYIAERRAEAAAREAGREHGEADSVVAKSESANSWQASSDLAR
jgi:hypothetical protein